MRVSVYLIKRPRDSRAWPTIAEDHGIAFHDKYRVSDIWWIELEENHNIALDFFESINIEAG
jgi:hypothetical protein